MQRLLWNALSHRTPNNRPGKGGDGVDTHAIGGIAGVYGDIEHWQVKTM
jgi:hypothetical protein